MRFLDLDDSVYSWDFMVLILRPWIEKLCLHCFDDILVIYEKIASEIFFFVLSNMMHCKIIWGLKVRAETLQFLYLVKTNASEFWM